jgi:hypothetical protein
VSVAPGDPVYPYGYARPSSGGPQGMGTLLTWEGMLTKKTVYNLHPEVQRRFHALILAAHKVGVPLGIGTGWRIQPADRPGFAKPGNSWHESCPVSPASASAFAIDTVPQPSWDWLEAHCGSYGFRTFRNVNNEPWHIQPTEIPAARKYATSPPVIYKWDLPGTQKPPPIKPPSGDGDMTPEQARQLADLHTALTTPIYPERFKDPGGVPLNVPWGVGWTWEYVSVNIDQKLADIIARLDRLENPPQ